MASSRHAILDIDLGAFGGSALTAAIEVPKDRPLADMDAAIPVTYVPARNTIFLSLALGWAETLDASDLFIGANALDYSGYPDCRPEFLRAFEAMARLGTKMGTEGRAITIHAPLIELTKAQIVEKGRALGVDFSLTRTCYDPMPAARRAAGAMPASSGSRGSPRPASGPGALRPRVMSYAVKEFFYTLQGEGAQTGRAAVFCRFAGCNLWTGREEDRADAVCSFCDTEFVGTDGPGGGKFATADALARAVLAAWPRGAGGAPYVVCTGGEPLLQLDAALVDALHRRGIEVAVETNGTQAPPPGLDWICVSPKAAAPVVLTRGQRAEAGLPAGRWPCRSGSRALAFDHFFLQPMDGPDREANTEAALRYCLAHPRWKMSLQTHKLLGIP